MDRHPCDFRLVVDQMTFPIKLLMFTITSNSLRFTANSTIVSHSRTRAALTLHGLANCT